MQPLQGFIVLCLYVFAVIGLAEGLRRFAGWDTDRTRKVIHIGVGMLIWFVPWLLSSKWLFVIAAGGFAIVTMLDNKFHFFKSMASKDDKTNYGTFYFPLAAALVVYLFWDQKPLMVAALMPLTWGDGMAEIIGRKYGRHKYTVLGHTRSLEGSLAFLVFGTLFTWLALMVIPFPPPVMDGTAAFALAFVTVAIAAVVEAVSIRGLDNLTITAVAIGMFLVWPV